MMFIILLLFLVANTCATSNNEQSFEDLNVQRYEANSKRLQALVDCFLDEGECEEVLSRLKSRSTNILVTICGDCSQREKEIIRDLAWLIITRKTVYLPRLLAKYDKDNNVSNLLNTLTNVPSSLNQPKVSGTVLEQILALISV